MRIKPDQLILVALTAALTLGLVFGLMMPHRNHLAQKRQQLRAGQDQLNVLIQQAKAPQLPEPEVIQDGPTDQQIDLAIPIGSELGPLLTQLGEDLQHPSVVDQQMQARAVITGHDFSRIPLSLRFKGDFEALFQFLQRIESRHRIMRIDRLDVRRDGNKPKRPVTVDIELSTFFRAKSGESS